MKRISKRALKRKYTIGESYLKRTKRGFKTQDFQNIENSPKRKNVFQNVPKHIPVFATRLLMEPEPSIQNAAKTQPKRSLKKNIPRCPKTYTK